MNRKTKLEIINETAAFYSADTSKRSANKQACFYLQEETGNMCAVGRCAKNPADLDPQCYFTNLKLSDEEIFKEEYQGHDEKFWGELQALHDSVRNWGINCLTEEGEENLKYLRQKYA